MRNLVSLFVFCLFATATFAQESLLSDLMNVEPVVLKADETTQESADEFTKDLGENQAKVDKLLQKHSEKFKKDVGETMAKFNKVLAKAIEQDIINEKGKVATQVNAFSHELLKAKKTVITDFENEMNPKVRSLPKAIRPDMEMQLKEIVDGYRESLKAEFDANKAVIASFRSTEHIVTTVD